MASDEELRAMGIETGNNIIICENCYEENEATRVTCTSCGAKLYKNSNEKDIKEDTNVNKKMPNTNKATNNFKAGYYYSNRNNNKTAIAVQIIGWLEIICGFILGIVLGNTFETGYYYREFNTGLCIGSIVGSIIIGVFILGFGEIIQLLQDIKDKK